MTKKILPTLWLILVDVLVAVSYGLMGFLLFFMTTDILNTLGINREDTAQGLVILYMMLNMCFGMYFCFEKNLEIPQVMQHLALLVVINLPVLGYCHVLSLKMLGIVEFSSFSFEVTLSGILFFLGVILYMFSGSMDNRKSYIHSEFMQLPRKDSRHDMALLSSPKYHKLAAQRKYTVHVLKPHDLQSIVITLFELSLFLFLFILYKCKSYRFYSIKREYI